MRQAKMLDAFQSCQPESIRQLTDNQVQMHFELILS